MQQVGSWAIDQLTENGMRSHYFKKRREAASFKVEGGFTLRRVNLEDAFLSLTGKKVK